MKKLILLITVLALLSACVPERPGPIEGTPVDIVKMYYNAWANKDYKTMYSLVSEGWKVMEPTARSEARFANNVGKFYLEAKGIRLVFASEQANTGSQSEVSAAIEVETRDGQFLLTNQTMTLRLKNNGWKLIHPYGEYTDLS